MALISTTPVSGGKTVWFDSRSGRKSGVIVERCTLVHGQGYCTLNQSLPARARITWAGIKNITALYTPLGDGTNTADNLALVVNGTATLPTTGTSSGATNIVVTNTSTVTSALRYGLDTWTSALQFVNITTSPNYLMVQPSLVSSRRLSFQTNGTNFWFFGTSTATSTVTYTVDVVAYIEQFDDFPEQLAAA